MSSMDQSHHDTRAIDEKCGGSPKRNPVSSPSDLRGCVAACEGLPRHPGHRVSPSLLKLVETGLDRMCEAAHNEALEILADDDPTTMESAESIRFAVYRCSREFRRRESEVRGIFTGRMIRRLESVCARTAGTEPPAVDDSPRREDCRDHEVLCETLILNLQSQTDACVEALGSALHRGPDGARRAALAFGPRAVIETYLSSLQCIEIEPELRIALMKAWHARLHDELPGLYSAWAYHLGCGSKGDWIPGSDGADGAAETSPANAQGENSESGDPPCEERTAKNPRVFAQSSEVLAAVLQLLAGRIGDARPDEGKAWSRVDVLRVIGLLQAQYLDDDSTIPDNLADLIEHSLCSAAIPSEPHRRLAKSDRAISDLVEMVVDFVVEDPGFPTELRASFTKLRIPILRLALVDRQALIASDNPARQLFEALVLAAAEFSPGTSRGDQVVACTRLAVRYVMERFEGDPTVLAEILACFTDEYRRHIETRKKDEPRFVIHAESRDRLLGAWREVAALVDAAIGHVRLPAFIVELLRRPWAQYMVLLWLRKRRHAQEWRAACSVVESIVAAFGNCDDPSTAGTRTQEAMRRLASTAMDLRAGLQQVGYSAQDVPLIWREMMRLLVRDAAIARQPVAFINPMGHDIDAALADLEASTAGHPAIEGSAAIARSESAAELPPGSEDIDPAREARESIGPMVGDWVDVDLGNGSARRLKLCWRGEFSGIHVFVNRAGVKELELYRSDVDRLLNSGALRMSTNGAVVDRALVDIYNQLDTACAGAGIV